jgi:hypothetical protein
MNIAMTEIVIDLITTAAQIAESILAVCPGRDLCPPGKLMTIVSAVPGIKKKAT